MAGRQSGVLRGYAQSERGSACSDECHVLQLLHCFGSTVALNDVEEDFCKFGGHCVKREVHVDSE